MLLMEYTFNGKKHSLKFSGQVKGLLQQLLISDQIVIVKRDGKIVTELDQLKNGNKVEIQQVIFGG